MKRSDFLSDPAASGSVSMARRVWRLLPFAVRHRVHHLLRMNIGRFVPGLSPEGVELAREYPKWIAQHDTLTEGDIQAITAHIARLPDPPTISVVMPVFNPAPGH